ncbi:hypothetical protein B0H21DRAFT_817737 [Amylocystis lapponica]|nr:hypothetical protein B0H21DRAFT_817737 [Amylocystis lapponica]
MYGSHSLKPNLADYIAILPASEGSKPSKQPPQISCTPYPPAPAGHVTLTRSVVLTVCGWSNTQFSYWARRAEAISVLASRDQRLNAGRALEEKLHLLGVTCLSAFSARDACTDAPSTVDECVSVTGKGLDAIIEKVKKRSGASQFLRGRHSILDAFGTASNEGVETHVQRRPAPGYMPTFQAEMYVHERPDQADRTRSE